MKEWKLERNSLQLHEFTSNHCPNTLLPGWSSANVLGVTTGTGEGKVSARVGPAQKMITQYNKLVHIHIYTHPYHLVQCQGWTMAMEEI